MRKFFRKFCCGCFLRSQKKCKKVESDGTTNLTVSHENGKRRNGPPPPQTTTSPDSIITQVTKESPGARISGRANDPNFVQSVLKSANLRSSLRGAQNSPQNNYNGALIHSYNGSLASADKKRPRIQEINESALLPPLHPVDQRKKCLVIDLDETLVHSSFKPVKDADFVIPVEIDNVVHQVHVLKRPYADEFLRRCGELFECVLFTASLDMYADPVANLLDKRGVFRSRLFRESCVFHDGNYVKDLNRLGRELEKIIIVDNSPISYAFHPQNAIAVRTWFDDPSDCELLELIPLLEELAQTDDIYQVLRKNQMGAAMLLANKELYG